MSKVDFRNFDINDIDDDAERFERIRPSRDNTNSKFDRDRERNKNMRKGSRQERNKRNYANTYDRMDNDRD